jgi:hypothetical protein
MNAIDFTRFNDQQLAEVLRTQVRQDSMSLQSVPPMQQMIVEAIARILARPVVVIQQAQDGEPASAPGPRIVKS